MPLDRPQWQRLSALLDEALDLNAGARQAWLSRLQGQDAALARTVAQLLAEDATLVGDGRHPPPSDAEPPSLLRRGGHASPAPPFAGDRLGAWELLEKIGSGGMGEVWLARRADGLYEARAAIKLLRSDLDARLLAARFARERRVLAKLNHPAIARLLDAGLAGEQAYLVLEHVQGGPLNEHVREHCPLVEQRVRLLMRIAEAVDHAHAQLIAHRDLKPSNVLVTPAGVPKLLDFGIAGLLEEEGQAQETDLTRQLGRGGLTLSYAAPEQILGEAIGTAADVFALGVMLFELLGGALPFAPRGSPRAVAEHAVLHLEALRLAQTPQRIAAHPDPASPGRPEDAERGYGDLEAVVAKALRKKPAERYGSVRELLQDLERWQQHRPVSVRSDDWRYRSRLLLRRHAALASGIGLVLLSLSLGLAAATWQWQRAEAAARQSDQVTRYLTDLLASAKPESHGGRWPTVLQLLDSSRADLEQRFADDPDTRLRLLQVLATSYAALNRFEQALPLTETWVSQAEQRLGAEDPATLRARLELSHVLQVQGSNARSQSLLEPLEAPLRRVLGDESEAVSLLLQVQAANLMNLGQYESAEDTLSRSWALSQRLHPGDALARADYLNNLHVLRNRQGRHREALAALEQTREYWNSTDARDALQILVLRRNHLRTQLMLAEFDDVEARSVVLIRDMDRVLGPGNDLAMLQFVTLGEYHTQLGQHGRAAATYAALFEKTRAEGLLQPADLLNHRAEALLARSRARPEAAWRPEFLSLQLEILGAGGDGRELGSARQNALRSLAALALLHDDAALAETCLAQAAGGGTRSFRPVSRLAQLEAQLARARGELGRARDLQRARLEQLEQFQDKRSTINWSAHLDLAYTQLLLGQREDAKATLDRAAQRRPASLPAGHPLDGVAGRLAAGRNLPRTANLGGALL